MKAAELQQQVTDKIISLLEQGTSPWQKPWTGTTSELHPINLSSGKPYNGINVVILWIEAQIKGYQSNKWLTYRQAQEKGGQVMKGEKSTAICFYKAFEKEDKDGEKSIARVMRSFNVFNLDQIDGIEDEDIVVAEPLSPSKTSEAVTNIFTQYSNGTGVHLTTGGNSAYYHQGNDIIRLPEYSSFISSAAYGATLLHEIVHSTGHKSRLNRLDDRSKEGYAFEELVAELGCAFLCAELGIHSEIDNHASYIESWLKALKNDKNFIFKAAAKAQAAYDYIHEVSVKQEAA